MSDSPATPLFGPVERRLFRATVILFALIVMAVLIGIVVWALARGLAFFANLVVPLCVAGILALILMPVVDGLERRVRLSRTVATSIIVLLVIAMIVGAVVLLLPILSRQIIQFVDVAPDVISGWQQRLSNTYPTLARMLEQSVQDGKLGEMAPDVETTTKRIRSYAGVLVGMSFVPFLLFFFLLSVDRLRVNVESVLGVFSAEVKVKALYFIDVFLEQVKGFFQGQLVIAVIMGAMLAAGFTLIGLKGGILVGLVLGLLNIVPFLGTLVGLLIVLPIAYFQTGGGLPLIGLSLLVFTVVQLVESWLLTPKIMANRSGLHPALVVISVFFWGTALGGITGMVLAVPLTAFVVAVWRQAKASLSRSMDADYESVDTRIQIPLTARKTDDPSPGAGSAGRV
ncbi:MAG: AI-2E family transporter [Gammaproteobacteria bacterium]|nr:AI-2E family transporter [Gammaproteobacteria bacterium]